MMGVPLSGPTCACRDNVSVIHDTQRPESVLKKKSNSICCHAIQESVAVGEILTCHVPNACDPEDVCTEVVPAGQKRDSLIELILFDLADDHGKQQQQ